MKIKQVNACIATEQYLPYILILRIFMCFGLLQRKLRKARPNSEDTVKLYQTSTKLLSVYKQK